MVERYLGVWGDIAHSKRQADMSPATADPAGMALSPPPRRRRDARLAHRDPVGLQLGDLGRADPGDGELGRHEEEVAGDQDDDQCKLNEHRDRTTRPTAPPHRGRLPAPPPGLGQLGLAALVGRPIRAAAEALGSTSRAASAEDLQSSPEQTVELRPRRLATAVEAGGAALANRQTGSIPVVAPAGPSNVAPPRPSSPALPPRPPPRPVTAPGAAGRA